MTWSGEVPLSILATSLVVAVGAAWMYWSFLALMGWADFKLWRRVTMAVVIVLLIATGFMPLE